MRTQRTSAQLGFTLIELMITIAILGVVTSLAASSFARSSNRASVHSAGMLLKSRIENTRGLAIATGSRFATERLIPGPSCRVKGNGLFIQVDVASGEYNVPTQVEVGEDGNAVVHCATFQVEHDSAQRARFSGASSRSVFSFTPSGRLIGANGGSTEAFLAIEDLHNPMERYGFRILGSGVVCRSANPQRGACDMDQE